MGGCTRVVPFWAALDAAVGGPVEVVAQGAPVLLSAVGRYPDAADALHCALLAGVGVPCSDVLAEGALEGAHAVADVEVVDQGGVVSAVGDVVAAEAEQQGGARAGEAGLFAGLAGTIGVTLVGASGASLDAGIALEVESQSCRGDVAAGAVLAAAGTGVAVDVALVAGVEGGYAELSTRAGLSASSRPVGQQIALPARVSAFRAGPFIPFEALCAADPAGNARVVADLPVVAEVALQEALVELVVEVGDA